MPKAKKVPKTEKMWMAWDKADGGFFPSRWGDSQDECLDKIRERAYAEDMEPVIVRIMPEAEYQRLRKAKKGGP